MKDITDADYTCMQKEFTKTLGGYHGLHLISDTLIFADAFKNVRKMCLKMYHLDPVKFFSAPGLAWQAVLKSLK